MDHSQIEAIKDALASAVIQMQPVRSPTGIEKRIEIIFPIPVDYRRASGGTMDVIKDVPVFEGQENKTKDPNFVSLALLKDSTGEDPLKNIPGADNGRVVLGTIKRRVKQEKLSDTIEIYSSPDVDHITELDKNGMTVFKGLQDLVGPNAVKTTKSHIHINRTDGINVAAITISERDLAKLPQELQPFFANGNVVEAPERTPGGIDMNQAKEMDYSVRISNAANEKWKHFFESRAQKLSEVGIL